MSMCASSLARYLHAQLAASEDAAGALRFPFRSASSSLDRLAGSVCFDLQLDQRIIAGLLDDLGDSGPSLRVKVAAKLTSLARLIGYLIATVFGRRELAVRRLLVSVLERRLSFWQTLESLTSHYWVFRDLDFPSFEGGARRQLAMINEFEFMKVDGNTATPISAASDVG